MGAFLFYIVKSAFCLGVFYVVFQAILSRSTFFRFNRLTLLAGMFCCMLLPFIELPSKGENFLNAPFHSVERALVESVQSDLLPGLSPFGDPSGQTPDAEIGIPARLTEATVIERESVFVGNWLLPVIGFIYITGAVLVFTVFAVSTIRMFRLIGGGEKQVYQEYTLVLVNQSVGSFNWGKYIVMSKTDYEHHPGEILLHEKMHLFSRHTLDLCMIQCFLIIQWFNPAVWLLRRELQEIHEYEADNKVINSGIDATRYQLLLVKKAVGTRLYSMANSFNHSKLKNRINMMLKERTNGWARLKLLLFVPVITGALYAFASPEVNETLSPAEPAVKQDPQTKSMDYLVLTDFLKKESDAAFIRRFGALDAEAVLKERQCHKLLMNARNQLLFDGDFVTKENLKAAIVKRLPENQKEMMKEDGKRYDQIIMFQCDRGTNAEEAREVLGIAKDAFDEIRNSITATSSDKSKEYLDKVFPIYIVEVEMKDMKSTPAYKPGDKVSGIELTLHCPDGTTSSLTDFTLTELQDQLNVYFTKLKALGNNGLSVPVSMKVAKDCNMAIVNAVRKVLRKNYEKMIQSSSVDKK